MKTKYSDITLLVDMDDTIEDLLPAWVDWINRSYGTSVDSNDITGWDVKEFFPSLSREIVYIRL